MKLITAPLAVSLCAALGACVVDDSTAELASDVGIGDDDIPEEFPPDPPTTSFKPVARSLDWVRMQWAAPPNVTSTTVQRRVAGGTWQVVRTYGETSGLVTYTNTGLTPDTRFCYRIAVHNVAGSAATPEKCVLTDHAGGEPVPRARLEIVVADTSGSGTDDRVGVTLNDTYWGSFTGLDYSIDDLEAGSTFLYDLDLRNIRDHLDINTLKISKSGNDSLCIRSFRLILAEDTVLTRTFGNTGCRLLNGTGSGSFVQISQADIRASSGLINYQPPSLILSIGNEELEERIEGVMGDILWANDEVHWGAISGEAVAAHKDDEDATGQSLDVDFDLMGEYALPPPTNGDISVPVDLHLTLRFAFVGDALRISPTASSVDAGNWWQRTVAALGDTFCQGNTGQDCMDLIEAGIADAIDDQLAALEQDIPVGPDPCPTSRTVTVTAGGGLAFGCAP
jgi:hypothetical protein